MNTEQMTSDYSENLEEKLKEKNIEIEELKQKLIEAENKLNELTKGLEQKIIERTVEVNRLLLHKTKFIDNLSHDLGTPLTPLVSLLPMIKDEITDPKTKEILNTCIRSAEYIKRVVKNTQELAELSTTDLYLRSENLLEIVNNLQEKYDIIFKSCNIIVNNDIDDDIFVNTEKSRLLKIFDHITSNAVNSMLDGGTLTFKAKNIEQKTGSFIKISISDTGKGLERDQIDHLFDEFYKADASRHKLDSTGLGLSICRRIAEKHGGRIWAESAGPGKGVTIHLVIPSA